MIISIVGLILLLVAFAYLARWFVHLLSHAVNFAVLGGILLLAIFVANRMVR